MLRSIKDLENYSVKASDGEIGRTRDLFVDDATWAIRYLVVQTGDWLASRKLLVSPMAVGHSMRGQKVLAVAMTREQVCNGPVFYAEKPVARQCKPDFIGFPGYPYQSAGPGSWGIDTGPGAATTASGDFVAAPECVHHERTQDPRRATAGMERRGDAHLRSCKAMCDFEIRANDGPIGKVRGVLVEEESWMVRYFIVNTGPWWMGHQVLIAPSWIGDVNWLDRAIRVDLARQQVQASPPYETDEALNRQRESGLFEHYGRKKYWTESRRSAPALAHD